MTEIDLKKLISNILDKYNIHLDYYGIVQKYSEPHRFFHTMEHITRLINEILKLDLSDKERDILILTAIFHDIIYNPQRHDNEDESALLLKDKTSFPWNEDIEHVYRIILTTKTHEKTGDRLTDIFLDLDMSTLTDTTFVEMLQYERKVFKEYQFVDYKTYKEERVKFLLKTLDQPYGKKNEQNIKLLADWVKNSTINCGVYAGSFNKFHLGHLNILKKSQKVFDKVILAIGVNPDKASDPNYINTLKNNVVSLKEKLNIEVCFYDGLLTDFIQKKQDDDGINITLIRGLRDGFDLSYENRQIQFMKDIYPELSVIYIQSDRELDHISSSSIRYLEKYDPELAKKYLV